MRRDRATLAEVSMPNSCLPRTSARTSCDATSSNIQIMPSPRLGFFSTVLVEFWRALAAARRYGDLRYHRACRDGLAPADIARRIFEEFYACRSDADSAPHDVSGRDSIDIDLRLCAWRAARIKALMSSALSMTFATLRETLRRAGRWPHQLAVATALTCLLTLVPLQPARAVELLATPDGQLAAGWNELAYQIAFAEDEFLTFKGHRALAMMHLAMHDALNTIDPAYKRYVYAGPRSDADPAAAAAQAAYEVLLSQYPETRA